MDQGEVTWLTERIDRVARAIARSADADALLANVLAELRAALAGCAVDVGAAPTTAGITIELAPGTILRVSGERPFTSLERWFVADTGRRLTDALASRDLARELIATRRNMDDAQRIANLGFWEHDLLSKRVTYSPELFRILGIPPTSDMSIAKLRAMIHPDDLQRQIAAAETAEAGDGHYDAEYRIIRPDGSVRVIHSLGDFYSAATGRAERAYGLVQDVTDRREAEVALRASEARFRTFVDHATDGFFVHGQTGLVVDVNEQACKSLGYTRDEMIGMSPEVFDPDFDVSLRAHVAAQLERAEVIAFESRHRRKDGTIFPVEIRIRPFIHGGSRFGLSLVRDISERKKAEQALHESQHQLRQAQKMEAVGRFAGGIAHDFNNVLMIILSAAQAAQSEVQDDVMRELVTDIAEAGERAEELTRQLLAFSRKQVLQPRHVDVTERLTAIQKLLARLLGEDVQLKVHSTASSSTINVDAGQLEQAIINLVSNARDAMPNGGQILIETSQAERNGAPHVCISVTDSGHGMDAETQTRIFEPFFTTKDVGRGTGLGLAMVYAFVHQFGGHIVVESQPGWGSAFRLYLPAVTAQSAAESPREHTAAPTGTETVLLVEDDDVVRKQCRRMLQASGYTVIEARDGIEAMDIARRTDSFHLLLTDCVMPRLGGQALAIKMAEERPGIGVLLMTGYASEQADANLACLQKPFRADEMARAVRGVLDARAAGRGSQPQQI